MNVGLVVVILAIIGLWQALKFFFSIPIKVLIIFLIIGALFEENVRLHKKIQKLKRRRE